MPTRTTRLIASSWSCEGLSFKSSSSTRASEKSARPRSVFKIASGCSAISFCIKCLKLPFAADTGS